VNVRGDELSGRLENRRGRFALELAKATGTEKVVIRLSPFERLW